MRSLSHSVRRRLAQPVRYAVVAGLTALGYLGLVAAGLAVGLHYFIAILSAQVLTIATAFPVYRRLVFRSTGGAYADFMRFLIVWSSGAISGIAVTPLFVELLHWHPLIAQVVAIAVVAVGSFLAHRFFTFARSDAPRGGSDATDDVAKPDHGR